MQSPFIKTVDVKDAKVAEELLRYALFKEVAKKTKRDKNYKYSGLRRGGRG